MLKRQRAERLLVRRENVFRDGSALILTSGGGEWGRSLTVFELLSETMLKILGGILRLRWKLRSLNRRLTRANLTGREFISI